MGSAIILIAIIFASLVCIRAGAIALELTGMERDKAEFQALSAFTNTGFTTREAEEIVRYPIRRKIITILIVLGYAGTVSVIATFATSLFQKNFFFTAIYLGIILAAMYVLYRIASWRGATTKARNIIRRWLLSRYGLKAPSLEEMLKVSEGFGIVRIEVREGLPLAGRPLAELELKTRKVQILAINRGAETITIPQGHDFLRPKDTIICYGDVAAIKTMFSEPSSAMNLTSGAGIPLEPI
jgi:TrkA-C domain